MELLESSILRPRQARYQAALRPDMKCTIDSKALSNATATPIRLSVQVKIRRARGRNTRGYLVSSASGGSSESSRTKIGVFTGSSTFEPLVMKASQSFFAAPKYPNPFLVPPEACAAPAPSKPKPFRPSTARGHAGFCRVESATALDGPISETGARSRAKVEVVALISPS